MKINFNYSSTSLGTDSILALCAGEMAYISRITGSGAIRQRLLDMGLLPKQELRLKRVAPSGDPVWIELNGTQLALRRKEAESVLITHG